MPYSRYSRREIIINDDLGYRDTFFVDRDVEKIEQYTTNRTIYPSVGDLSKISSVPYQWRSNTRLFNVAHEYYGSPELWWVIAWFNKKPTEAQFTVGETFYVPLPLSEALYLFDRVQEG
jgi:hypothetical protein